MNSTPVVEKPELHEREYISEIEVERKWYSPREIRNWACDVDDVV